MLFTDGTTDLKNAAGGIFGLERLVNFAQENGTKSTDEIVSGLFVRFQDFCGAAVQFDDITIVVIRRLE